MIFKELGVLDQVGYIAVNACPFCKSADFRRSEEVDMVDVPNIGINCQCRQCSKEWHENYVLDHIDNITMCEGCGDQITDGQSYTKYTTGYYHFKCSVRPAESRLYSVRYRVVDDEDEVAGSGTEVLAADSVEEATKLACVRVHARDPAISAVLHGHIEVVSVNLLDEDDPEETDDESD